MTLYMDTIKITVNSETLLVGDELIIYAESGLFNADLYSNIIILNDDILTILSGDRNHLITYIPANVVGGLLKVETGYSNTGYENNSISNSVHVNILYENKEFTIENIYKDSIFNNGFNKSAIYNKDFSYSKFSNVTDENSMVQNLYTILLTPIGSRFFNNTFGSTISSRLFSVIGDYETFESSMMKEIKRLVDKYEPRISIIAEQSFIVYNESYNEAQIILSIKVPTGNVKTVSLTFKNVNNKGNI